MRHLIGILVGFVVIGTVTADAAPKRIEAAVTVVDGDTLHIEGTNERVRLYAIDAPESDQTCDSAEGKRYLCGGQAAQYLAGLIGRSGRVMCFEEDRDRHGRIVAECSTAQNIVLNAAMVKAGWAVEYRRYSDGRYDREEAEAKADKRGLWAGRFIEPWKWRDGARLPSEYVAAGQPEGCAIKGNISGSNRIYHSPDQEIYAKTKIDIAAGERWFCSAAEAEAAGWRPAKR